MIGIPSSFANPIQAQTQKEERAGGCAQYNHSDRRPWRGPGRQPVSKSNFKLHTRTSSSIVPNCTWPQAVARIRRHG